jgi:hypothetical protein
LRQSTDQRKAIEAYGNFWNTLIELCVNCHANASQNSQKYNNASEWMALIVRERRSLKNSKIAEGSIQKGKGVLVDLLRDKAKLLSEERNPEDERVTTHMFRLYEDCFTLIQSDVFQKKYWVPHIRALRTHLRELESNPTWVSTWIEDGKCYEQSGKGRAKRLVPSPESFLT